MKQLLRVILILFYSVFLCTNSNAADDIIIRSSVSPESPWPGQKVTVNIDILGTDGWAQIKNFHLPNTGDGHLIRFETQGTRLNENIKGKNYSGQRYELLFFPRRAGQVEIPQIPLEVTIKKWGEPGEPEPIQKHTPAISLLVAEIPGQENNGIISTTDFTASQTWSSTEDTLDTGNAITREIILEATDVSAMLFPPMRFPDIEGTAIYPAQPEVKDSYNKGELTAKRVEKVTYVFEQPGQIILPELKFSWWNVSAKKNETIILPGRELTITGTPASSGQTDEPPADEKQNSLAPLIAFALILPAFLFFLRKKLSPLYRRWIKAGKESEKYAFKRIERAAQSNDPVKVLRTTMQWLDRISTGSTPARLDTFIEHYGDNSLRQVTQSLLTPVDAGDPASQVKAFFDGLQEVRKNWIKERKVKQQTDLLLPEISINPSSNMK